MKFVDNVEKFIEKANAVPSAGMNRRTLSDIFEAQEESRRTNAAAYEPNMWRVVLLGKAGCLAAAFAGRGGAYPAGAGINSRWRGR